jgi:fucose permease
VALSHIGFLFVGIANTLLGPVLPLLSERWKLSDTQGGYLFTAQFTGAIAGSALSGALMKKLGVMPVLAAGYGGAGRGNRHAGVQPLVSWGDCNSNTRLQSRPD